MARCTRCGQPFAAGDTCEFHPGQLCDYNTGRPVRHLYGRGGSDGDFWDCCKQQVDGTGFVSGCTRGPHTTETLELRRGIEDADLLFQADADRLREEEYLRRVRGHQG